MYYFKLNDFEKKKEMDVPRHKSPRFPNQNLLRSEYKLFKDEVVHEDLQNPRFLFIFGSSAIPNKPKQHSAY